MFLLHQYSTVAIGTFPINLHINSSVYLKQLPIRSHLKPSSLTGSSTIKASIVQSFAPYNTLSSSQIFTTTNQLKTYQYTTAALKLTGLCKFMISYSNNDGLFLSDVEVSETSPLTITNPNLCNGDFEVPMNNALYTPTGFNYNFRTIGSSTMNENQYYYGWTKLKLSTITDTAKISFDKSSDKISGNQSLKYTKYRVGSVHATKSTDHQLAWVFAGVKDKNYIITFKAKSSSNTNIGVAISSWDKSIYYKLEKTILLTPELKTYTLSTATAINHPTDTRSILSFCMGNLPRSVSVWIDDVTLVEGVPVNTVSISAPPSLYLNKLSRIQLSANVSPVDATLQSIVWSSSNEGVATVDANGLVTGVSQGDAIIMATSVDGEKMSSLNFKVSDFVDTNFSPPVLDSLTDVYNPGRGFYRWISNELIADVPSTDNYLRFNWSDIENNNLLQNKKGKYIFNNIESALTSAKNDANGKGKFGFGIRCLAHTRLCSYPSYLDDTINSTSIDDKKNRSFLVKVKNIDFSCKVPNWNNPYFLERIDSLIANLGRAYNNDPRLGYIEIRTYGDFGEWQMTDFTNFPMGYEDINATNYKRIIDAYVRAFPDKQLIMMSDHTAALEYALSITGLKYPIGWRRDSWCNKQFLNVSNDQIVRDRWKTAPIIVESYNPGGVTASFSKQQIIDYHISAVGNGNFSSANTPSCNNCQLSAQELDSICESVKVAGYKYQLNNVTYSPLFIPGESITITAQWSNLGVAPTYNDWDVVYRLTDKSSGIMVKEWTTSSLRLKELLPTYNFTTLNDIPKVFTDHLDIPSDLPSGVFDFELYVADHNQYFDNLKLSNVSNNANNCYGLGEVTVNDNFLVTKLQMPLQGDDISILNVLSHEIQIGITQSDTYNITLFSIEGSCLLSKKLNLSTGVQSISLPSLSKGVYVFKIMTANQQKAMRFMVN